MPGPVSHILLVEDDEDVGELLRFHLEALGHRVTHVLTGEDGLTKALADPPGLAVVDIQLPGVDGREVVRRLRADPATASCRIVVSTIVDADEIGIEADAVIAKPFHRVDIARALQRAGFGPGDGGDT